MCFGTNSKHIYSFCSICIHNLAIHGFKWILEHNKQEATNLRLCPEISEKVGSGLVISSNFWKCYLSSNIYQLTSKFQIPNITGSM